VSDTSIGGLAIAGEDFRVGRVLSRSLALFLGNFPKYSLYGVATAVPHLMNALYTFEIQDFLLRHLNSRGGLSALNFGSTIIWAIVFSVCQAAMIHGTLQDIRGHPFDIGASIRRSLSRMLPVIGTAICAIAVVALGFVLLVVPGFIFVTMFYVVIPVCVVESLGPIRSLGRSRELTKGHRWQIFAIYLVPAMVLGICHYLLHRLGIRYGGITGYAAGIFLLTAIGGTYQAIVNIVTYYDLRSTKEGLDVEHLAAVFD